MKRRAADLADVEAPGVRYDLRASHSMSLLLPMAEMREHERLLDLLLCVDGAPVPCHAVIAAAASRHIRVALCEGFMESDAVASEVAWKGRRVRAVELNNAMGVITLPTLQSLVGFMYSGVILLDGGNCIDLLFGAEFLEMLSVSAAIEAYLKSQLGSGTWVTCRDVGDKLCKPGLSEAASEWVSSHWLEAVADERSWGCVPQSLLAELLRREGLSGCAGEDGVLDGVLSWAVGAVKYAGARSDFVKIALPALLADVRLLDLSLPKLQGLRAHRLFAAIPACGQMLDACVAASAGWSGCDLGEPLEQPGPQLAAMAAAAAAPGASAAAAAAAAAQSFASAMSGGGGSDRFHAVEPQAAKPAVALLPSASTRAPAAWGASDEACRGAATQRDDGFSWACASQGALLQEDDLEGGAGTPPSSLAMDVDTLTRDAAAAAAATLSAAAAPAASVMLKLPRWLPKLRRQCFAPGTPGASGAATVCVLHAGTSGTSVKVYDAQACQWLLLPRLSQEQGRAACASLGRVLFVLGGEGKGSVLATTHRFDRCAAGFRGEWKSAPRMCVARRDAAAAELNGVLYCAGGSNDDGFLASMEALRPPADGGPGGGHWELVAPLSLGRASFRLISLGGYLYAVGGMCLGGLRTGTVERFDPALNVWSAVPSLPLASTFHGACALGGKLYVAGGTSQQYVWAAAAPSNAVLVYDPVGHLGWRQLPALPGARAWCALAGVRGALHLFGGLDAVGQPGAEVGWRATPAPLPVHPAGPAVAREVDEGGGQGLGGGYPVVAWPAPLQPPGAAGGVEAAQPAVDFDDGGGGGGGGDGQWSWATLPASADAKLPWADATWAEVMMPL